MPLPINFFKRFNNEVIILKFFIMLNCLLISFALVFANIVIRTIITYSLKKIFKDKTDSLITTQDIVYEGVFVALVLFITSFILNSIESINNVLFYGFILLQAALLVSYSYILQPLVLLHSSTKDILPNQELIDDVEKNIGKRVNIYIINKNIINAFAMGAVPFSEIILIGKVIHSQLNEQELKAILYHEVGHLQLKHLQKMYLVSLVIVCGWFCSHSFLVHHFEQANAASNGLKVALHASFWYALLYVITGFTQRKLEYEADIYAAKRVGKAIFKEMLLKMNEITNGGLTIKSIHYPTLNQRLSNVDTI
jgi:Zn-dependent protease with chaperone function